VPLDLIQNALQICVGPYLDEQEFRDVNTINAQVQGEFLEKAVWREVGSEEARLRASLRPPRKLHVRFSRMQLSRRHMT